MSGDDRYSRNLRWVSKCLSFDQDIFSDFDRSFYRDTCVLENVLEHLSSTVREKGDSHEAVPESFQNDTLVKKFGVWHRLSTTLVSAQFWCRTARTLIKSVKRASQNAVEITERAITLRRSTDATLHRLTADLKQEANKVKNELESLKFKIINSDG